MKTSYLFALPLLLALAPLAQAEDIPPNQAPQMVPYSYTISAKLFEKEGDKESASEAVLRVDPSRPAGERVKIVSATDPEADSLTGFINELEKPELTPADQAEGFWCAASDDREMFDPENFTVISETDTEMLLRPKPQKLAELLMQSEESGDMDKDERKMMKRLVKRIDGHVRLSKPDQDMRGFKVWMTRPMTIMIVAKLKEMEVEQNCAPAPNGQYYVSDMKMRVRAKALGQTMGQDMDLAVSDLTPLMPAP